MFEDLRTVMFENVKLFVILVNQVEQHNLVAVKDFPRINNYVHTFITVSFLYIHVVRLNK